MYNKNYKKFVKLNPEEYKQQQEDRAFEASQKILNAWNSGNFAKMVSLTYLSRLGLKSDTWSMNNKIQMSLNNTQDARTFLQWKEVGRKIKKDTKAFFIFQPIVIIKNKGTAQEEKLVFNFKPKAVHRIEDTEPISAGLGEITYKREKINIPPFIEVAKKWGISINYNPDDAKSKNSYGFFQQSKLNQLEGSQIVLGTKDEFIFLHELIHSAHLKYLLSNKKSSSLANEDHTDKEIIAQFGACILANMYNIDCQDFTYTYLENLGTNKKEIIKRVMGLMTILGEILKLIFNDANITDDQINDDQQIIEKTSKLLEIEQIAK